MGGHAAGDIASRIAIDVVDDRSAHLPTAGRGDYFAATIREAHEAILRAAAAEPSLQGMGTTLTLLHLDPATGHGTIAHIGDSRAYRWRDGSLERLTRDQTWVQDQIDAGVLTPEQARGHPYSAMLTSALGVDRDLDIQLADPDARAGDLFLLCSDGLTARLADDDLGTVLESSIADDGAEPGTHLLARAARALVNAANDAGGPDNITVALLQVLEG